MDKRLISILILTICLASFDSAMNYVDVYSVNWDIFFFTSIYGFVFYQIYLSVRSAKDPFKHSILFLLSSIYLFRIALNIFSINRDYEAYSSIVSNPYTDRLTWGFLLICTILVLWQKYQHSQLR